MQINKKIEFFKKYNYAIKYIDKIKLENTQIIKIIWLIPINNGEIDIEILRTQLYQIKFILLSNIINEL